MNEHSRGTHQHIMRLFEQKRPQEALWRLDNLLWQQIKHSGVQQLMHTLEYFVERFPNVPELRERLIEVYLRRNCLDATLKHLDALGEIQLEAGMYREAARTLRRIATLLDAHNPPPDWAA